MESMIAEIIEHWRDLGRSLDPASLAKYIVEELGKRGVYTELI